MTLQILALFSAAAISGAQPRPSLAEFVMEPAPGGGHFSIGPGRIDASSISLRDVLAFAHEFLPDQILGPSWLDDRYRVLADVDDSHQTDFRDALRAAVDARLKLRETSSTKLIQVFELRLLNPEKVASHETQGPSSMSGDNNTLAAQNIQISQFIKFLAGRLGHPVIDRTDSKASYTFDLAWNGDAKSLARACRDQLGLDLVEVSREMPVISVDRQR